MWGGCVVLFEQQHPIDFCFKNRVWPLRSLLLFHRVSQQNRPHTSGLVGVVIMRELPWVWVRVECRWRSAAIAAALTSTTQPLDPPVKFVTDSA